MTYKQFKKILFVEKECKEISYISYDGNGKPFSNFLTSVPSYDHVERAEKEGLLVHDWDTWIVVK